MRNSVNPGKTEQGKLGEEKKKSQLKRVAKKTYFQQKLSTLGKEYEYVES